MADSQIDGLPLLIAPDGADVAASKTNTDYRIRVGEANGIASLGADGKVPSTQLPAPSGATWGSITGTMSSQTDLDTALAGKSNTGHTHTTSGITDLSSYTGFDSRYYTESEANSMFGAKASLSADVTFRNITAHQNSNVGVIYFGNTSTHYLSRNVSNNWEFVGSATMTVGGNTVWTSGNDGPSSGLNADLLDGQHGSYYATASHTHTAANISDSTTTGRAVLMAASQDAGRDAIGIYVQSTDPGAVTDGSLWIW